VKVSDLATGRLLFEARRPGVTTIAVTGPHTVLCGRAATGVLGSSIVRIDTRTGETATIAGTAHVTFSLIADPGRGTAYSLGVDRDGKTDLLLHAGPGLDSESVLDSAQGELLSASATVDQSDGVLYDAFDQEMVESWSGGVRKQQALPIRGAVALRAADGILASLDKDSLVSIWDARAGRPLGDISLFSDDGWAVTLPDGSYAGSSNVENRVAVFLESRLRDVSPRLTNPPPRIQSKAP
jgi:hypothetical protein